MLSQSGWGAGAGDGLFRGVVDKSRRSEMKFWMARVGLGEATSRAIATCGSTDSMCGKSDCHTGIHKHWQTHFYRTVVNKHCQVAFAPPREALHIKKGWRERPLERVTISSLYIHATISA